MKSQLLIPKKIKVGFNLRSDTYTGKLGYIIYHDGKAWRKQDSWERWRQKYMDSEIYEQKRKEQYDSTYNTFKNNYKYSEEQINQRLGAYENYKPNFGGYVDDPTIVPVEFENVPIEGFVLNKKAGGYSSGWNHRATYCRVYDPRGFEFEISIPNLLFILQETSSFKGKGLEGEFVYAWEGKDLILLPANCEDYKQSQNFTKLQQSKVSAKDLEPGCSYKTKRQIDLIYLGKFNWYSLAEDGNYHKKLKCEKVHVFYDEKNNKNKKGKHWRSPETGNYVVLSSVSNIASQNSDIPIDNYAELMQGFSKIKYTQKPINLEFAPVELGYDYEKDNKKESYRLGGYNSYNYNYKKYYIKKPNEEFESYNIHANWFNKSSYNYRNEEKIFKGFTLERIDRISFKGENLIFNHEVNHDSGRYYTKEELESMGFNELFIVFENGNKLELEQY